MIRDNVPGLGRLVVLEKLGLQESVLAHEITRISVIVDRPYAFARFMRQPA